MARNDPIQHVVIDDFRPGIVSSLRTIDDGGYIDLPPGTATEDTVGCIANATGQLVALPAGYNFVTYSPPNMATSGLGANRLSTSGLAVSGPVNSGTFPDFVHVLYTCIIPGIPHFFDSFQWDVIKPPGTVVNLASYTGQAGTTVLGTEIPPTLTKRGATHVFTRTRSSNFSQPGFPCIATEWTGIALSGAGPHQDGSFQRYAIYPNPAALTSDTPYTQSGIVDNATFLLGGQLLAHSGRIIRLCENAISHGAGGVTFLTNERVRYTDPPNSRELATTTQDSTLDPQYPGGYGSWGSISFGELLLVKRYGGALLVEGDVYAPQITRLPGVASTGRLMNPASWCAAGLVYAVENDGAYIWNGGNTSRKINKINDTFYEGENAGGAGGSGDVPPDYGVQTDHTSWNNLIVFTSGWSYDAVNDSWWRLQNPHSIGHIQWLAAGVGYPSNLYTTNAGLNADNKIEVMAFDSSVPGVEYTWVSQPIPTTTNKTVDVAEVDVSFSNNVFSGTQVTVALGGLDGTFAVTDTFTVPIGVGPFRLRKPLSIRCNGLQVYINVVNDTRAPTLNSIVIGYREAGPLGQG